MSLFGVNPAGKTNVSPLTGGPDGFQLPASLQRLKKVPLPVQVSVRAVAMPLVAIHIKQQREICSRCQTVRRGKKEFFISNFLPKGGNLLTLISRAPGCKLFLGSPR